VTLPRIAVALFGPQGQGSFNESGHDGVLRARANGHAVDVHWVAPLAAADRAEVLRGLCRQGLDLLVAHGGQGDAPVAAIHAEFPDMQFAVTQGSFLAPNVASYEVLQEQSAFLAGVLAGLASNTRVVAHMSGEKVRPGLKGRAAFASGVRLAAPDCRFVTTFCGQQHDPELAFDTTRRLQLEGADLVFAMIDGGRAGVTRACRALPIRQIGNVLDWVQRDPDVFVASAVADSGRGLSQAIGDFAAGRLRPGSAVVVGLEQADYVRLVVAADLQARFGDALADWSRRVLSGEVLIDTVYSGPEI
jgi:basic membrane protein A